MNRTARVASLLAGLVLLSSPAWSADPAVAAGAYHALLLMPDGTVRSWGSNTAGMLGDGTNQTRTTAVTVLETPPPDTPPSTPLSDVIAIATGMYTGYALKSDHTVWSWGSNSHGELGDPTTNQRFTASAIPGLTNVTAIAAGQWYALALKDDGTVWMWGYNGNGQKGDGTGNTSDPVTTPIQIEALGSNVVAIGAGGSSSQTSYAIKSDGTVWAWGTNQYSTFGNGTSSYQVSAPVQTSTLTSAAMVAAGGSTGYALDINGQLYAWGDNQFGQVGDGGSARQWTPEAISSMPSVLRVSGGGAHALAVRTDGTVWAWGYNMSGELGNGNSVTYSTSPLAVPGLTNVVDVAAGTHFSVAVSSDGHVWTWGDNTYYQLGDGTNWDSSAPLETFGAGFAPRAARPRFSYAPGTYTTTFNVVVSSDTAGATIHYTTNGADPTTSDPTVASGGAVSITSTTTLKAKAWADGMLDSNVQVAAYTLQVLTPSFSPTGGTFTQTTNVTMSTNTSGATIHYTTDGSTPNASSTLYSGPVALSTSGTVKAVASKSNWADSAVGSASYTFNFGPLNTPTASPTGGTFEGQVAVTLSADTGATIRYTTNGADPTATSTLYTQPLTITTTMTLKAKAFQTDHPNSTTMTQVYTIRAATPTFTLNGGSYAPGTMLTINGDASTTLRITLSGVDPTSTDPVIPAGTSLLVGGYTIKVKAFKTGNTDSPVAAATYSLTSPLGGGAVAAGSSHTVLATPDGLVYAWGLNTSGQVGDSTTTMRTTPKMIATLTGVTKLAAGSLHTLAVTWDGRLFAWGSDGSGRLGDGGSTNVSTPKWISAISNVVAVAAGSSHSLALTASGQVYAWGAGSSGQLGLGNTSSVGTPTLVTSLSNIVAIGAGDSQSFAVTSSGQLYAWGYNGSSQLGDGGTTMQTSPKLITGISGVAAVVGGTSHTIARLTSGAVYTWGANSNGQLAQGNTNPKTTPTVVSGLAVGALVSSGANFGAAVRSDGVLVGWGLNSSYQLGTTTPSQQTAPTVVPGAPASVALLATGTTHTVAVTPDGHVWTWGNDVSGQLGDGNSGNGFNRATPTDVFTSSGAWGGTPVPMLTLAPGTYHSTQALSVSAMNGAVVHYTSTGATPTESDPVVSGVFSITQNVAYGFRAFALGLQPSAPVVAAYELQPLPPTLSPAGGTYYAAQTVTLDAASGTTIRYTLDGTAPTANSPLYSAPLSIPSTATVKAVAFESGWTASTAASSTYQIIIPTTSLTLLSPASGANVNANSPVTAAASVTSNVPIVSVNFFADATLIGSDNAAPYQATWTPTQPGTYTVIAQAVDDRGGVTNSSPATVVVHSVPVITSVSPTSGAAGAQVIVTGTGFGVDQGNSMLWLGSKAGAVSSWSDTQIVGSVATGSVSGSAQVRQTSVSSNSVSFTVLVPTITSVSPNAGSAGTSVTINGSTFGDAQGAGQVWLGTAPAIVTTWTDSQIVATVATGSTSGNAQVLQNGTLSNAVAFTIGTASPHITSVSPTQVAPAATFTIFGTGFGATQGGATVVLAGAPVATTSWTDTAISATAPSSAVTGLVKVQRAGVWSNAVTLRVGSSGPAMTLTPNLMNLLVGDTRGIQALDDQGVAVTGLAWSSSDPTVVSLSSDNPPILTALAAGGSTISAGNASAEVTVYAGSELPTGTVVWSVPGNSSGVSDLHMAVPNYDAIAEVFAEQRDGSVQALTGDGLVAWTSAPLPPTGWGSYTFLPDFQGGLVAANHLAIYRLAPMTGQLSAGYIPTKHETLSLGLEPPAIHPDGTVVTIDYGCHEFCGANQDPDPAEGAWVVGINPDATEKFRVPLANSTDTGTVNDATFCQNAAPGTTTEEFHSWPLSPLRIAGDGYVYTSYQANDVNGTSQRSAVQPYSDDQYDLWDQLVAATGNSDFAAAITALDAMAPSIGTSATSPVVSNLGTLLQNGDRTGAISLENQMVPWFIRPCDSSWTRVTKLHLLRVAMDGSSTDVVAQTWTDTQTTVFTLAPGWVPGQILALGSTAYRETVTHTGPDDLQVYANAITNTDEGAMFSWRVTSICAESGTHDSITYIQADPCPLPEHRLTTMNGGMIVSNVIWHPNVDSFTTVEPELQLEDDSFVAQDESGLMVFDTNGTIQWTLPGYSAQLAAPGALIAQSSTGTYAFDASGAALGRVQDFMTQSWFGNSYRLGSVERIAAKPFVPTGFWPQDGGNPSGVGARVFNTADLAAITAMNLIWPVSWQVDFEYGGLVCRSSSNNYYTTGPVTSFDSGEIDPLSFPKAACRQSGLTVADFHAHGQTGQPYPSGLFAGTDIRTDIHRADVHTDLKFYLVSKPLRASDVGAVCPAVGCVATNSTPPARSIYWYQGSASTPNNAINNVWQKLPMSLGDPAGNGGWVSFPIQ